jgi:hypothetical protein
MTLAVGVIHWAVERVVRVPSLLCRPMMTHHYIHLFRAGAGKTVVGIQLMSPFKAVV